MKTRTIPLIALLLGLTAAGCAEDKMSLEAYGICGMPDTCEFADKCDLYHIGGIGYFSNGGLTGTYALVAAVEVRNQLQNNEDLAVGRVNSNDAHITSMRLEVDGPASGAFTLDVGHQAVPAEGSAVVFTYLLPPGTPTGTYNINVFYIGYYDNGREFETPGFPIAVDVDDTAYSAGPPAVAIYGCPVAGDIIVCGTDQQNLRACGAP